MATPGRQVLAGVLRDPCRRIAAFDRLGPLRSGRRPRVLHSDRAVDLPLSRLAGPLVAGQAARSGARNRVAARRAGAGAVDPLAVGSSRLPTSGRRGLVVRHPVAGRRVECPRDRDPGEALHGGSRLSGGLPRLHGTPATGAGGRGGARTPARLRRGLGVVLFARRGAVLPDRAQFSTSHHHAGSRAGVQRHPLDPGPVHHQSGRRTSGAGKDLAEGGSHRAGDPARHRAQRGTDRDDRVALHGATSNGRHSRYKPAARGCSPARNARPARISVAV